MSFCGYNGYNRQGPHQHPNNVIASKDCNSKPLFLSIVCWHYSEKAVLVHTSDNLAQSKNNIWNLQSDIIFLKGACRECKAVIPGKNILW